jgi:hypothetical protein
MSHVPWLRCTNMWEWLMVCTAVLTVLDAFCLDWLLGLQVGGAGVALYCLGMLNGMRLTREEMDRNIHE